jgi:hypothetical protein
MTDTTQDTPAVTIPIDPIDMKVSGIKQERKDRLQRLTEMKGAMAIRSLTSRIIKALEDNEDHLIITATETISPDEEHFIADTWTHTFSGKLAVVNISRTLASSSSAQVEA